VSRQDRFIESTMRDMTILKVLTYPARQWIGMKRVCDLTGYSSPVVHRHLVTLVHLGLVEQDGKRGMYQSRLVIVWPDEMDKE
jgi:DNA-binding IclR family transcriptional regulator